MKTYFKIFLICLIALNSLHASSQSYMNNWCFGDSIGLNFSTDPPSTFHTSINTLEACASISDSLGNLLFYTNGENIWNKGNEVMENGDSIEIHHTGGHSGVTQGVLIIPSDSKDSLYYVFYIAYVSGFIEYAIVNMKENAGEGKVVEKNLVLNNIDYVTEKMTAVKHGNGRDWWLIMMGSAMEGDSTPFKFVKYLITPSSIEGPYYQDAAFFYEDEMYTTLGQMKFCKNGSKLISTREKRLDIYDFDRCTGNFSNLITIDTVDTEWIYGAEFSEDGDKIYVSSGDYPNAPKILYQFCFSCASDINSTKKVIYDPLYIGERFTQMQLAENDKIYLASYDYLHIEAPNELNTHLSVINSPDNEGLSCNFDTSTISTGGKMARLGLPNMPNYNLGALTGSDCDTLGLDTVISNIQLTETIAVSVFPNPASGYITIKSQFTDHKNVYATVFNCTGKRVKSVKVLSDQQKINIDELAPGIYFIELVKDNLPLGREAFIVE